MKRVLFLLVSALLAGSAFASNLSKEVVAKVTGDNETSVGQQDNILILEQPTAMHLNGNIHYSHSSHSSHSSHRSHVSHFSSK